MGIFKRHQEQVRAAMRTGTASTEAYRADDPATAAYNQKLHLLGMDEEQLRNIQSLEAKIAAKAEMFGNYTDHVRGWLDGVRAGGAAVPDAIVTTMMLWAIDLQRWNEAISIAETVLEHRVPMHEPFKRTSGCVVAEEIANAALKIMGTGGSGAFPLFVLDAVEGMTHNHDMPDQARAKLHKALGLVRLSVAENTKPDADGPAGQKDAQLFAAHADFIRALQLDPACGVKTHIRKLEPILATMTRPFPPSDDDNQEDEEKDEAAAAT